MPTRSQEFADLMRIGVSARGGIAGLQGWQSNKDKVGRGISVEKLGVRLE